MVQQMCLSTLLIASVAHFNARVGTAQNAGAFRSSRRLKAGAIVQILVYSGQSQRIVADRHGQRIVLGWADGMEKDEVALIEAEFEGVSIEEVIDRDAEALAFH